MKKDLRHLNENRENKKYIDLLRSKDVLVQLKAAKEFYFYLLNQLKQIEHNGETSFLDNLIPSIRELASEKNQNLSDKQACVYIITSIINLDNINVKIRKKYQTILFRWLKNLLTFSDPTLVLMVCRSIGKYVKAGVECDIEFKSGLEYMCNENELKRLQGVLLIRELSVANHSKLLQNFSTFFENILVVICDQNDQIRQEAVMLFRLGLKICLNKETKNSNGFLIISKKQRLNSHNISSNSLISNSLTYQHDNLTQKNSIKEFIKCVKITLNELEKLLDAPVASKQTKSSNDNLIHGYLQVIVEILRFSNLDFELKIENYLSKYSLNNQEQSYNLNGQFSKSTFFEDTDKTCEKLHASNLKKLLPFDFYDPFDSEDQFLFLFNKDNITVSQEFKTCQDLISSNYERLINILNYLMDNILRKLNMISNRNFDFERNPDQLICLSIINILLDILPRLAILEPKDFESKIFKNVIGFLESLNFEKLKSKIIFTIGLLSLALTGESESELFFKRFMESFHNNSQFEICKSGLINFYGDQQVYINELNSIMACISIFANKYRTLLHETDSKEIDKNFRSNIINAINKLIESLMASPVGVTFTMRHFLSEISIYIPELETSINQNLLDILCQNLTGYDYLQLIDVFSAKYFRDFSSNNQSLNEAFQILTTEKNLFSNIFEKIKLQSNNEAIIQALKTLRYFRFSDIYLIILLRYCVDFYLQHQSRLVKIETVLTSSKIIICLIDTLNSQNSRSLNKIILYGLKKLLITLINENEPDVRYHVLNSLYQDSNFYEFLSLAENLNVLFMCIYDERIELRELSALLISKISYLNPIQILPFIRKTILKLLNDMDILSEIDQQKDAFRLLGQLLSNTPKLVNLYGRKLMEIFNSKLCQNRYDVTFASSLVTLIGQLASKSQPEMIQHFEIVIPFLIESMQNVYCIQLKNISLWALGQIISNTGYAIEPYKKYPDLLDILFDILHTETSITIRHETIRILGCLGAIDPYEYKKSSIKYEISRFKADHKKGNTDANAISSATCSFDSRSIQLKMDLIVHNQSLEEYFLKLAINFIMIKIKHSDIDGVRKDAIQALVVFIRTLNTHHLDLVIPQYLELIEKMSYNIVIDLVVQFGFLVKYIRRNIPQYLSRIFLIIENCWNKEGDKQEQMLTALIDLLESIVNIKKIEFKENLIRILPLILKYLQKVVSEESSINTAKLLQLLRSVAIYLDEYVHLILSQFSKYLSNNNINNTIKTDIMFTIYTFAIKINLKDSCVVLFQSFKKILEEHYQEIPTPNVSILSNNPLLSQDISSLTSTSIQNNSHFKNTPILVSITFLLFMSSEFRNLTDHKISVTSGLGVLTFETLNILAGQMKEDFLYFAKIFDEILIKNENFSKIKNQLVTNSKHLNFGLFLNQKKLSSLGQKIDYIKDKCSDDEAEELFPAIGQAHQINFTNLKVCIDRSKTKEGWRQSFQKFMISVVQETPSTLRACSLILNETIPTDLFNACFISIWVKLDEKEQNEIAKYLDLALRDSNEPETIKILLDLAEFIEKCGLCSPFDYRLLGDKAIQVKAYAKALFYVEEQFRSIINLSSNSNQSCLSGIGGVCGAGGIFSFKKSKTLFPQQDQQQNLIYLLEQLVSINNELQKTDAAVGVLDFSSKYLQNLNSQTKVKEKWYEKLYEWQKALSIYERELNAENPVFSPTYQVYEPNKLNESNIELLMGRMRCLKGLGEWQKLNLSCSNFFNKILNQMSSISNNSHYAIKSAYQQSDTLRFNILQTDSIKEKIAEMGAAACWGLGDWDQMKTYVKYIPENTYEGSLYRSVISLTNNEIKTEYKSLSLSQIKQTRFILDSNLTSMATNSYDRTYKLVMEAQILTELEEIIEYKCYPSKRDFLIEIWWKRLQGCERSLQNWHKLLLVRSIVLPREEYIKPWLKFSSMCQKAGRLNLSQQILDSILSKEELLTSQNNYATNLDFDMCRYAYFKFLYANNQKKEAFTKLNDFVSNNLEKKLKLILNNEKTSESENMSSIPLDLKEIENRKFLLQKQFSKCNFKLGKWKSELDGFTEQTIPDIIMYYNVAKDNNKLSYKCWQSWAYANNEALVFYDTKRSITEDQKNNYIKHAINGFFTCISLSSSVDNFESNSLQDTLRLLNLLFNYCYSEEIYDSLNKGIESTPVEIWLKVIPQLIARIDTNKLYVARLVNNLLIKIGNSHPQALIYRLILVSKCNNRATNLYSHQLDTSNTSRNASLILDFLKEKNLNLITQAKLVSEELIRVAILWNEMWHESIEEASKLYVYEQNPDGISNFLTHLHDMMNGQKTTENETDFFNQYSRVLNEAKLLYDKYLSTRNISYLKCAWQKYHTVFFQINDKIKKIFRLNLNSVSHRLMNSQDLELVVPGTYEPNKPLIRIKSFGKNVQVIASSKQKPKKLEILGSNGCQYLFLLKGHEDLRQDERVMQIFGLVNDLLTKNRETERQDLAIQRYNVIPLSQYCGLLQWLLNCDTLNYLIKEYRDRKKIRLDEESRIIEEIDDYVHLTTIRKIQIFEEAIEKTKGNDLAEILWEKSSTTEDWLDRRSNFTVSLAVMSMVGYVIGLGDRHPSNLMIDRVNGKIIHIDFGDCFETAMNREKFPEKIPFRLTRMLKNAMEVTGIEGTFRKICESVMNCMRINQESLMAVLEAFVYDPLINWRLMELNQPQSLNENIEEEMNRKAILVLNRVRDKLNGTDFKEDQPLDVQTQVDLLIKHATSSENLSQCFFGWCAWW